MKKTTITHVDCPQCGEQIIIEGKVKRQSFTNIPVYKCANCGFKGAPPLSIHTQIWYWATVVCVAVLIYYAFQGYSIRLGILGLLVPFALYHDWRTRKKVSEYRAKNGLPAYADKVEGEVFKGALYSVVIIAITFFFSPWVSTLANQSTTSTVLTTNSWQPYHSVAGNFTLNFPTTPTVTANPLTIPGYSGGAITETTYESDMGNTASYIAEYTVYPSDLQITNHQTSLEGVVNGSVNNVQGGTLVSSNYTTVNSNPAVDYLISVSSKGIYLKSRAIEVGQALYVMEVSAYTQDPANYDEFIGSFTLTQ